MRDEMYLIPYIITEIQVGYQLAHLGYLTVHCVIKFLLMINVIHESLGLLLNFSRYIGTD